MAEKIDEESISWEEATSSSGFVRLVTDVKKTLVITNWKLVKRDDSKHVGAGEVEFVADVLKEDGEECSDKLFTSLSKRLKQKLKPILETRKQTETVSLTITRVGEQFNTQYSVEEVKDGN